MAPKVSLAKFRQKAELLEQKRQKAKQVGGGWVDDVDNLIDEAVAEAMRTVLAEASIDAAEAAKVTSGFVNNVQAGKQAASSGSKSRRIIPTEEDDEDDLPATQPQTQPTTRTVMDTLISQKKIDFWIKNEVNVMLIGKHGIGKTHIAKDAAKKARLGFQYFSCATLDPWVDFIGVPKTRYKTVVRKGKKVKVPYLELVRPKAFAFDEVEFLFLDELNRADPKVMNAVLELIQFRSINGKKFKNLKCIWAAINPPASMTGDVAYHVQELDPALMSRFQVRINLPFEPALNYFSEKFGKAVAKNACNWWKALPDNAKDDFPPRSMDYALDYIQAGGDVEDVLPPSVAKQDFIKLLDQDFNVDDVIAESYDLVKASSDALSENLLTSIRYASTVGMAAPYVKKVRESTMEEVVVLALNILGDTSLKQVNSHLMTLVSSLSRPLRIRLLSDLYSSYMAIADDDDDADEVEGKYDLSADQVRGFGHFVDKKLEDLGAKFKYRKKRKTYELTELDHDALAPCENAQSRTADDILSRVQAAEEKKQNSGAQSNVASAFSI